MFVPLVLLLIQFAYFQTWQDSIWMPTYETQMSNPTRGKQYPGSRAYGAAVSTTPNTLYLFGGLRHTDVMGDLWKLTIPESLVIDENVLEEWEYIDISGDFATTYAKVKGITTGDSPYPGARERHNMHFDSENNLIYLLFGWGYCSDGATAGAFNINDFWKFDTATQKWTYIPSVGSDPMNCFNYPGSTARPGGRSSFGSYLVTRESQGPEVWIFGGFGCDKSTCDKRLADMYKYDADTELWSEVIPTEAPEARARFSYWTDQKDRLFLFGGETYSAFNWKGDVWMYKISLNTWEFIAGFYPIQDTETGIYTDPQYIGCRTNSRASAIYQANFDPETDDLVSVLFAGYTVGGYSGVAKGGVAEAWLIRVGPDDDVTVEFLELEDTKDPDHSGSSKSLPRHPRGMWSPIFTAVPEKNLTISIGGTKDSIYCSDVWYLEMFKVLDDADDVSDESDDQDDAIDDIDDINDETDDETDDETGDDDTGKSGIILISVFVLSILSLMF